VAPWARWMVDGRCVVDAHVARSDIVRWERNAVSGVSVGEVHLVAVAGVDLPAVAVAHPVGVVGSVGEAAIVRAGHDCLSGEEQVAADADVLVGVEVSGVEESFGDGGVELIDDGVGGCHDEHVATLDDSGERCVCHGDDCCGLVGVTVDAAVAVVGVDCRGVATQLE